ncbi:hypothetical protein F5Y18DRAFT_434921 [Xylariaceae sp. FL1019]|nr:hypothetical protein F5Y18DRAFT_434921 [Xylariaceae sp. FL1019]
MVNIRAAGGKTTFCIPFELLAPVSNYFNDALNNEFPEGRSYDFTFMENCTDDVLQLFTSWAYLNSKSNSVHRSCALLDPVDSENFDGAIWARAWLFGDYIQAIDFQNAMMKVLFDQWRSLDVSDIMEIVWHHVPVGSPLDRIILESLCYAVQEQRECGRTMEVLGADSIQNIPVHAAVELAIRLTSRIVDRTWDPDAPTRQRRSWSWLRLEDFLIPNETRNPK